jgi:hypothetical protein
MEHNRQKRRLIEKKKSTKNVKKMMKAFCVVQILTHVKEFQQLGDIALLLNGQRNTLTLAGDRQATR